MHLLASALILLTSLPALGPIEEARELIAQRRWSDAETKLERVIGDPSVELTEIANARQDAKAGIEWGKQAIKASPDSSNAHYQYALALRNKMQTVSGMRSIFTVGSYRRAVVKAVVLDDRNIDAPLEQIEFLLNAPGFVGGSKQSARERAVELKDIDWRAGMFGMARVEAEAGSAVMVHRFFSTPCSGPPIV